MNKAVTHSHRTKVIDTATIISVCHIVVNPAVINNQRSITIIVDATAISRSGGLIIVHDARIERDRTTIIVNAAAMINTLAKSRSGAYRLVDWLLA
ncbi:MAG: hypothetical protein M3R61_02095 [Chloroflexota bacterium]|nr:hypothetical protein [Chloroflexota bacterium]